MVISVISGKEQTAKLSDRHDRPSKQHTLNLFKNKYNHNQTN